MGRPAEGHEIVLFRVWAFSLSASSPASSLLQGGTGKAPMPGRHSDLLGGWGLGHLELEGVGLWRPKLFGAQHPFQLQPNLCAGSA